MPKMKTRKAIAKRFRITAGGKIKHAKGNRSHLLTRRASNRMRRLRRGGYLDRSDEKMIKRVLPYS